MEYFDQNYLNFFSPPVESFPYDACNFFQMPMENSIENIIDIEMNKMRTTFHAEENDYVEEMLSKQPVVVERRKIAIDEDRSMESMQKAESCRQSRINNKVRKVRMRFRHQFANQRMKRSADLLVHMRNLVAEAEMQLLCKGFTQEKLHHLRDQFGMERPERPESPDSPTHCWSP